jgi:hypothetical protein
MYVFLYDDVWVTLTKTLFNIEMSPELWTGRDSQMGVSDLILAAIWKLPLENPSNASVHYGKALLISCILEEGVIMRKSGVAK